MYCSFCANPITSGLSFCNRCGAGLREREPTKTGPVAAFLTAITLIGVCGLGIMLGGALALRNEAHLDESTIILFMMLTFLIVATSEILLIRQLARFANDKEKKQALPQPPMRTELRASQRHALPEPMPSVTENTTRTLEYSQREPVR